MDRQARVQQYLTERRRLRFHLRSPGHALPNFARFFEASKHTGALTVAVMASRGCTTFVTASPSGG